MPILIDDVASVASAQIYTPKFFSPVMTGDGKGRGLLNSARNPSNNRALGLNTPPRIYDKKEKVNHNGVKTNIIPLATVSYKVIRNLISERVPMTKPQAKAFAKIAKARTVNGVYLNMTPYSVVIEEHDHGPHVKIDKKINICYQIELYIEGDKNSDVYIPQNDANILSLLSGNQRTPIANNYVGFFYTENPYGTIHKIITELNQSHTGYTVDDVVVENYITDYCLYSEAVQCSENWQTKIADITMEYIGYCMHASHNKDELIKFMVTQLDMYPIPLAEYTKIYNELPKLFTDKEIAQLCKQNIQLLLSDTLNGLEAAKPLIPCIPNKQINAANNNTKFSTEQQKAISSTEPFVMTQAGAGTGKSTVILGRVDHMVDVGIAPEDIMVLSFTNAAADNITAKNPKIKSMTIARMIHTIYSANFPTHELSNIDTIINALHIYFNGNNTAYTLRQLLNAVGKNQSGSYTALNNFIEDNFREIMGFLDTIKQTSLELEIIMCYQLIDTLTEPKEVQSKYLIVDEVQDNSIFEFVYYLKYVNKHKESLFIVGDCSQTLYEFRASNPKALSMLEASGIFTSYQLQTNYRSNQEILDFANVLLGEIEANQFAQIQLRANSLAQVTKKSFTEKVTLDYNRIDKAKDVPELLQKAVVGKISKYVDDKLAKNEKVTFLAFSRANVAVLEKALKSIYPNKNVVSIVPKKVYNNTIFSQYIKLHWSKLKFAPHDNIVTIIHNEIINNLPNLVTNAAKAYNATQDMMVKWHDQYGTTIKDWQKQLRNGQITTTEFLNNVRSTMMEFEIKNNAVKQALISAKNEQNKTDQDYDNADIILSTIHSAKGLEFDNVVVIYHNSNNMPEDKKRMYYVAFTRAMKTEYVFAYDTVSTPVVQSRYDLIVGSLQ